MENLVAALIGAVIGGACSFGAVYWQARSNDRAESLRRRREVEGFLRAAATELRVLNDLYDVAVGPALNSTPPGQPFRGHYVLSPDYFTVYASNAGLLGRVEDDDLRDVIVRVYTSGRSLLDALRLNSALFDRLNDTEAAIRAGQQGADATAQALSEYMLAFVPIIHREVTTMKALLGQMTQKVDAYIARP